MGSLDVADTVSLGPFESHGVYAAGHLFFVRGGNLMAQPFDADARQPKGDPLSLGAQTGVDPPWQRGMFSVSATGRLVYSPTARTSVATHVAGSSRKVAGHGGDPGVFFNLDLSPDERRVAVSQMTHSLAPRRSSTSGSSISRDAGRASRLTDDPAWEFDPAWSS